jgi:hypothetical protein
MRQKIVIYFKFIGHIELPRMDADERERYAASFGRNAAPIPHRSKHKAS